MLKEWLIETVGLEKDRAESIAEKFIACGCHDLTALSKRNRGHDNYHSINILDIELEEWEAMALSSAIDEIVLDDDFFSSDSAFKLVSERSHCFCPSAPTVWLYLINAWYCSPGDMV